jgi:hypothetical protein
MHYFPIIIEVVGALVVVDTVVVDVVVVVEVEVRVVVVVVVERFETQNPPEQTFPGQQSPLLWYTMFLLYTNYHLLLFLLYTNYYLLLFLLFTNYHLLLFLLYTDYHMLLYMFCQEYIIEFPKNATHRLNMELDLQSFIWVPCHLMCTAVLIG